MTLDPDACYRALVAHDARFDGRVYVGVSSTGIYCRPVCRVRTPRRENCRFFASAAAAESRGFRPCLRCRPELAPGHASIDAGSRLAAGAVDLIEGGVLDDEGMAGLAARVGVSDRHLRRLFETEFGVSPIAYAQTHRLLLAKQLLTDTSLPVTEIAHASGFASVRRFNALFASRYRMSPSRLRRAAKPGAVDGLAFELAYRPPYAFDTVLAFLGARAIDGVESVAGRDLHAHARPSRAAATVHAGRIAVQPPAAPRRAARRAVALARARRARGARARAATRSTSRPIRVEIAAALGPLARADHEGLRVPGAVDGFELATRAIVGPAGVGEGRAHAARPARRRRRRHRSTTACRVPRCAFRPPRAIAAMPVADLARVGLVRTRADALHRLATEVAGGALRLDPGADVESTLAALVALPGVGPLDRALHRHARAALARCLPRRRPHRPAPARRTHRGRGRARERRLAAVARLRGDAPLETIDMTHALVSLRLAARRDAARGDARRPRRRVVRRAEVRRGAGGRLARGAGRSAARARARRTRRLLRRSPPRASTSRSRRAARRSSSACGARSRRFPAGETISYGELARRAGKPAAVRAAAAATGRNPLSIVVPCHRIVGADGALTGYAGGLERKRALLALEGARSRGAGAIAPGRAFGLQRDARGRRRAPARARRDLEPLVRVRARAGAVARAAVDDDLAHGRRGHRARRVARADRHARRVARALARVPVRRRS